ncbi:hypothetical protein EII34_02140 [Arachnia propionica]|uniref:Uncharacterized protein n=1 Tax=Arachnia propionica TaxID=1750 RepID=A0A3P1TEG7_9ACTN|nr:hypothetical protein [Arachnia propionica]MDO5081842.1 hypothetical protein [Arachnia propionica]RRD07306.1 hypothetical protein EII34_02140 [Arachnia propionica]
MVGTLIKHETRRTLPALAVIHGIATLAILTGGLLASLTIPVLSELAVVLVMVLLSATWFAAQIWLAVDFWNTGFGQRGYLTHSLPVKGALILRARLVWAGIVAAFATVWMIVMGMVSVVLVTPMLNPGADGWERLATGIRVLDEATAPWQLVLLFLLGWFFVWAAQVNLYFAASLGSTPPLVGLGMGGPVLVWIGTWLVTQILGFASLLIPLAYTDLGSGAGVQVADVIRMLGVAERNQIVIPLGWLPLVMMGTVVLVFWMRHIWNHRISLR